MFSDMKNSCFQNKISLSQQKTLSLFHCCNSKIKGNAMDIPYYVQAILSHSDGLIFSPRATLSSSLNIDSSEVLFFAGQHSPPAPPLAI